MKAGMFGLFCALAIWTSWPVLAQAPPQPASPPLVVTLEDALARAKQHAGQIQSGNLAVLQAKEDTFQARAARKPSVNAFNQFIYTEGNATPSGVFVSNDGVHVYNEQAVVHQELLSVVRRAEVDRALAGEAIARARVEVAARGLSFTVVQNYYAIISAQRRVTNAQRSVGEAQRFLDITQKQERGGEVAHADVVKAQIDLQQRRRDLAESEFSVLKAKINLGVLIFPTLTSDYSVVDNLQPSPVLSVFTEAQSQAIATNPDLKLAKSGLLEAGHQIRIARYQYIPSLGLDFFYGINANQFAWQTKEEPGSNPLYRRNLGFAAQATLNIPVWNWGATRSKVKQAEYRRDQASIEVTIAQRFLQGNLAAAYTEAQAAQSQLDSLRGSVDLAQESLRLTLLRYQAGESTALEVVDAQNTLTLSRNAYDDGLARFRVAVSNLQILMGTL